MPLPLKHTSFYDDDFNVDRLLSDKEIFLIFVKRRDAKMSNLKDVE